MSTFATQLKIYMDKANMKQAELAEKTKINKSSISEYLSGNYEPKQRNIYKIATALGIKPSQLMGIEAEEPAPLSLSHQEETLIKKYRQLDADGKERVNYVLDLEYKLANERAEKEEENLG